MLQHNRSFWAKVECRSYDSSRYLDGPQEAGMNVADGGSQRKAVRKEGRVYLLWYMVGIKRMPKSFYTERNKGTVISPFRGKEGVIKMWWKRWMPVFSIKRGFGRHG